MNSRQSEIARPSKLVYRTRTLPKKGVYTLQTDTNEMEHNIQHEITCAPSEDSDQPAHPRRLIRVFAGHYGGSQGSKTSSGGQRRLITQRWSESTWHTSKLVENTVPRLSCSMNDGCNDHNETKWSQAKNAKTKWRSGSDNLYSRLSLSRSRLSRITAYLELKTWSLF